MDAVSLLSAVSPASGPAGRPAADGDAFAALLAGAAPSVAASVSSVPPPSLSIAGVGTDAVASSPDPVAPVTATAITTPCDGGTSAGQRDAAVSTPAAAASIAEAVEDAKPRPVAGDTSIPVAMAVTPRSDAAVPVSAVSIEDIGDIAPDRSPADPPALGASDVILLPTADADMPSVAIGERRPDPRSIATEVDPATPRVAVASTPPAATVPAGVDGPILVAADLPVTLEAVPVSAEAGGGEPIAPQPEPATLPTLRDPATSTVAVPPDGVAPSVATRGEPGVRADHVAPANEPVIAMSAPSPAPSPPLPRVDREQPRVARDPRIAAAPPVVQPPSVDAETPIPSAELVAFDPAAPAPVAAAHPTPPNVVTVQRPAASLPLADPSAPDAQDGDRPDDADDAVVLDRAPSIPEPISVAIVPSFAVAPVVAPPAPTADVSRSAVRSASIATPVPAAAVATSPPVLSAATPTALPDLAVVAPPTADAAVGVASAPSGEIAPAASVPNPVLRSAPTVSPIAAEQVATPSLVMPAAVPTILPGGAMVSTPTAEALVTVDPALVTLREIAPASVQSIVVRAASAAMPVVAGPVGTSSPIPPAVIPTALPDPAGAATPIAAISVAATPAPVSLREMAPALAVLQALPSVAPASRPVAPVAVARDGTTTVAMLAARTNPSGAADTGRVAPTPQVAISPPVATVSQDVSVAVPAPSSAAISAPIVTAVPVAPAANSLPSAGMPASADPPAPAVPVDTRAALPAASPASAPRYADADAPTPRASRRVVRDGAAVTAPVADTAATPAAPVNDPKPPLAGETLSAASADRQVAVARHAAWADGIARDIAAVGADTGSARFTVASERLGPVHVAVTRDAGNTDVRLTASSAEAQTMLTAARPQLLADAKAHGLDIRDAQVDLGGAPDGGGTPDRDPQRAPIAADPLPAAPQQAAQHSLTDGAYGGGTGGEAGRQQPHGQPQPRAATGFARTAAGDAKPTPRRTAGDGLYA